MVEIKRNILPKNASNVPGKSMTPKYITVHNTANTSRGANAEMHSRYQHNGSGGRKASWHYSVDDTEIWQTLEDNQQGWHAGDGSGTGNTQSIGIEICENSDGDFEKAVRNAQWLINKLMNEHNIPIENVVTHKHWSGKNCPRKLLNRWDEFKDGITDLSNLYRVQLGAYKKESNADKMLNKAIKAGFSDAFKVAQDGLYKVQIGAYSKYENAERQAVVAEKKGFDVYITGKPPNKKTEKKQLKTYIQLPASAKSWLVYKPNRPAVASNSMNHAGKLSPSKFGGLEYEVISWDIENVVAFIETRDFGKVKIFVDPKRTSAKIIKK